MSAMIEHLPWVPEQAQVQALGQADSSEICGPDRGAPHSANQGAQEQVHLLAEVELQLVALAQAAGRGHHLVRMAQ